MTTLAISMLLLLAMPVSQAADTPGIHKVRSMPAMLDDDDGGKVESVTLESTRGELSYHGGAVITHPRVVAVFVGKTWASEANAVRKSQVLDILRRVAITDEHLGMKGEAIAVSAIEVPEKRSDLSDLDVHHVLADALRNGALPPPDSDVIHVVLLAPELTSHIAHHKPGADYLAYHSHVQIDDAPFRYIVIPGEILHNEMSAVLTYGVTRTVLNPDGDAWY